MAVEKRFPHTIHLAGDIVLVNDIPAGAAILPGALVQRTAGQYLNHAVATGLAQPAFALEQDELNRAITHPYALNDLIKVGVGRPGAAFLALLASGQNVADGALLASAGNGTLTASATNAVARAIQAHNNTTGLDPRVRVEVI